MKYADLPEAVLLVDDFSAMRRIVKILLQQLGCENIVEAEDGPLALQLLESNKVSLIIADWTMPRMSGLELLNAVRNNEKRPTVPFIMMMTVDEKQAGEKVVQDHGGEVIVKPFIAEELGKIMHKVLSN